MAANDKAIHFWMCFVYTLKIIYVYI
jgi:hypothetical protein